MLNKLQQWEVDFRKGILKEIKDSRISFTKGNLDKIISETSFKSRHKKYPTFDKCPYVEKGEPCHPEVEELNCFLCSCPNYDSSRLDGGCNINSKKGKFTFNQFLPLGKVWDCSDCNLNHSPREVKDYLEKNFEQLKREYESLD